MSTSGTYTWTMTLQSFVNAALRKLAVLSGGSFPETYETTNAVEAVNAMISGFQADGMPLWVMDQYSFPTEASKGEYSIGPGYDLPASTPPLKVTQAWRSTNSQANIPMNVYTDYNFNLLPQTAGPSTPVNLHYQPDRASGIIKLWPIPLDTSHTITIKYQKAYQDLLTLSDEIDFPRYWYEAIIYGLASRLAPEYGLPLQDRAAIRQEAEYYHTQALSFGTEEGSVYLQPDWSGR